MFFMKTSSLFGRSSDQPNKSRQDNPQSEKRQPFPHRSQIDPAARKLTSRQSERPENQSWQNEYLFHAAILRSTKPPVQARHSPKYSQARHVMPGEGTKSLRSR